MNTINRVFMYIVLAIGYLGFVLPFLISHRSDELPIIGAASLVCVILFVSRKIITLLEDSK